MNENKRAKDTQEEKMKRGEENERAGKLSLCVDGGVDFPLLGEVAPALHCPRLRILDKDTRSLCAVHCKPTNQQTRVQNSKKKGLRTIPATKDAVDILPLWVSHCQHSETRLCE
jgi:hypothetical protein